MNEHTNMIDQVKALERLTGMGDPVSRPLPESTYEDDIDTALELVLVAVVVKYGGSPQEAAFKFVESYDAILKKHNVKDDDDTLGDKLEALKASVGDEMFGKIATNPEIERIAARNYRRVRSARQLAAISEISALFNNAVCNEYLYSVMTALTECPDPVGLLTGE